MPRAVPSTFFEPVLRGIDSLLEKSQQLIAWERTILGLASRKETHHDLVNLPDVAERIMACYARSAGKRSVSLILDIAPDALVIGNSPKLHDVMRKLIVAAIENTPVGGRVAVAGAVLGRIVTLTFCSDGLETTYGSRVAHRPGSLDHLPLLKPAIWSAAFDQIVEVITNHGGRIEMKVRPTGGIIWQVCLPVSD